MKRWFYRRGAAMLLALVILLLAGCSRPGGTAEEPSGTTQQPTAPIADPSGPSKPDETVPDHGAELTWDVKIPEPVDGKYFFDCGNLDADIYSAPNTNNTSISFMIYSTVHYNKNAVLVEFPLESDYQVTVYEFPREELLRKTEQCAYVDRFDNYAGYPYYLYQSMQGMDWEKLWQTEAVGSGVVSTDDLPQDELLSQLGNAEDAWKEWEALYQQHWQGYQDFDVETLPEFYAYAVMVIFPGQTIPQEYKLVDEQCSTVDITMGQDTYTCDLGSLRLHSDSLWGNARTRGLLCDAPVNADTISNPYTSENYFLANAVCFTAKEDITLTGLQLDGGKTELLGAGVLYGEGLGAGLFWDGTMEIDIPKGSLVSLGLYIRDPELREYSFHRVLFGRLDYVVNEREYSLVFEDNMDRTWRNPWEVYYTVFAGADFSGYYRDYYVNKFESWRGELE